MKNEGMKLYLDYTRNQESPILFHAFVAVSITCATLARKVYVAPAPEGFEGIPIYPNSYIVLVGPSGKVYKSSAIRWGEVIIRDLPGINVIRDKLTPQYLLKFLQNTPDAYILATELKTFIGTDAFVNGLSGILTNLHDADEFAEYRTKGSGVYLLNSPCVNILGGSTPEWLVTGTPADATSGGFSARFLYVVQEKSSRVITFPYKDKVLQTQLSERFFDITTLLGCIPLGEGVWNWYDSWYHSLKKNIADLDDERTMSYYSRKQTHIWKVAIALMALRGDATLTLGDIQSADQMLKWLELTLPLAFRSITYSTSTRLLDRVVENIAKEGGEMERSHLLHSLLLYADVSEVDATLSTLRQSGVLGARRDGTVFYRLLRPVEEVLLAGVTEEEVYNFFA